MIKNMLALFAVFLLGNFCHAAVEISNVSFTTRWPWNGLVDITFTIGGANIEGKKYSLAFEGYDNVTQKSVKMNSITGVGWNYGTPVHSGTLHAVWNAAADSPNFHSASFQIKVTATDNGSITNPDSYSYLVIDLSAGPNAAFYPYELRNSGPTESEILSKQTTQLWLCAIPAGRFTMGSPGDEVGRHSDERQHITYISKHYYMGIYEITQAQWELVMGDNPSKHVGASRPVENVSYDTIRGGQWPTDLHTVDASSFMGRIQARTGLTLDLPTEAQWEHACRALSTGYLYNGDFQIIEEYRWLNDNRSFIDTSNASNEITVYNRNLLSRVARWDYNREDGKGSYTQHTMVGLYTPNNYGLYDMHGNVYEWCLDWFKSFTALEVVDPTGPDTGSNRVCRGGSWKESDCDKFRSAYRATHKPNDTSSDLGFRITWHRVN